MTTSEALWHVFKSTGHIGAYLLYRQYSPGEKPAGHPAVDSSITRMEGMTVVE